MFLKVLRNASLGVMSRKRANLNMQWSLPSPRHAITAYHCFTSEKSRSKKLRLKFGGLCHSQGSMNDDQEFAQECFNGTDMYTADFEFAMFDWDVSKGRTEGDFAIVQLKTAIDEEFFNNNTVDIACLPENQDESLPKEFYLVGWGVTNTWRGEKPTKKLHYVKLKTLEDCGEEGNSDILCGYNYTAINNQYNYTDSSWYGAAGGDSGGGTVYYSEVLQRYVLIGVINRGDDINTAGKSIWMSKMVAVKSYLEDICYYIGICGENQYGYYRVLDMGSIYFPDGDRSKYPDLKPFEGISLEENKEIEERCSRLREKFGAMDLKQVWPLENEILNPELNSEKVCKMLEKYEAEARGWSFRLMHENKTYCGLTAVTRRHFVTSSECVRNMLEILNGSDIPPEVKHSSDDDENATFKVHVIGWHDGKYPLAILQINERIPSTYVVCLQYSIGFKNREPEGFVPKVVFDDETNISIQMSQEELANSGLHYATKKQCNVEGKGMFFCAKPYNRPTGCAYNSSTTKAMLQEKPPNGYGVFDLTFGLAGIHLKHDELETENRNMYLGARIFVGAFCIFLNRCEPDAHTFISLFPYFNHFYEVK